MYWFRRPKHCAIVEKLGLPHLYKLCGVIKFSTTSQDSPASTKENYHSCISISLIVTIKKSEILFLNIVTYPFLALRREVFQMVSVPGP